jgi:hypothetical protein
MKSNVTLIHGLTMRIVLIISIGATNTDSHSHIMAVRASMLG